MRTTPILASERGQATVELVAILPALVLACAIAWQIVLAGHSAWLAAHAARAGARAVAVGRDAGAAARSALPRSLEDGLRVSDRGDGRVQVRVDVPLLLPSWHGPLHVGATAGLETGQ